MRNLIRTLIAALPLVALPAVSQAGLSVGVSVNIAPPALPVYVQPPCPAQGYLWMPGYWAWDEGYYWVPGTWVMAPAVGLLWTPGYWGWSEGAFLWHAGYWGPHVGFYGGINYGFGYTGVGYAGGYWHGDQLYYNRSVTNINTTNITNVYNRTVVNNVNVARVSFNGGAGGVAARPTAAEISAEHERHLGLTPVQRQQQQLARTNSSLRAAVNGGRPAIATTARAGVFANQQHTPQPTRESTPAARAPQPQHYADAQSGSRAAAFGHESAPQYQHRPEPQPQYQRRPEPQPQYQHPPEPQPQPQPQYQHRPEPQPQYQPRPAPHSQPTPAPQEAGRAAHAGQHPEHAGEHKDHG
jgi:WXXGXW repeat (2 copies)